VQYVNENLGMAVGAMFVREHFKEDSKEIVKFHFNFLLKINLTIIGAFFMTTKSFFLGSINDS
jgi:predicted metalloendopeptidase